MIITSLLLIPKIKKNMAIYKSRFTGAEVDSILSSVANKQDVLTAGNGINISEDNVISVSLNFSLYEIVVSLPTDNIDNNKIYLVPSSTATSGTQNTYTEYLHTSGGWEILGQLQSDIDLSIYATKTALAAVESKANTNTSNISTIQSNISTINGNITSINNKLAPITDVEGYEVILFKK